MEEKNELNDIILNKGTSANSNKKIVLAVATLGVLLILVVVIMNSLNSSGTENLPQAVLPPEPKVAPATTQEEEPLFEEVEVVKDETQNNTNLDQIAQRLKEQSAQELVVQEEEEQQPEEVAVQQVVTPKQVTPKKVAPKQEAQQVASAAQYYIQVGSFSKYEPNKAFLKSITDKGYSYKYHKVSNNGQTINKVLVGPFATEAQARKALVKIRSSVEAGAFLTKI
jgi:DedD protein